METHVMHLDSEEEIERLEEEFPLLAGLAFANARAQALAAGHSVVETGPGNVIREVFPDGSQRVVGQVEPPTTVQIGETFRLR